MWFNRVVELPVGDIEFPEYNSPESKKEELLNELELFINKKYKIANMYPDQDDDAVFEWTDIEIAFNEGRRQGMSEMCDEIKNIVVKYK